MLGGLLLLGLTGGIVLAVLYARGELAGADARAYWAAVRVWLAGGDPYQTVGAYLPYSYAPWTLVLFLPWAMLPWSIAWFLWRGLTIALFSASVIWAFRRRPLATGVLVALLGAPLAANLDTGNVAVLMVLATWLAWFLGPRAGGLSWALAVALKWVPLVLLPFIPARARLWGVAVVGVAVLLTLATWPQTLRQVEVVLYFPRPLRADYLILAWGVVPWLWREPWPPPWLSPSVLARRWRGRGALAAELSAYFGFSRPGSAGTSTASDLRSPER